MSDNELDEREAARLRDLLHRAAERLDVTDPTSGASSLPRESRLSGADRSGPGGSGPGRWLVAAAVVVLAGVGAAWWLDAPDDRIDAVPAHPATTVAPRVLEERGIWRLPEGLDGYRVVSAMTSPSVRGVLLAVDDVDEPTRWLALATYGGEVPLDERTRVVDLADDMELVLRPVDGPEGITRFGMRVGDSTAYVTGTFRGVEEEDVVELLSDAFADAGVVMDADLRAAALRSLRLPDGLVLASNPDVSRIDPRGSLVLTLVDRDGERVVVVLESAELPPAVAALGMRLVMLDLAAVQGSRSRNSGLIQEIEAREDLGPHVFHLGPRIDERPAGAAASQLLVIAGDGTKITATRFPAGDGILDAEPLDEAEQLRIINSLRAMSAEDFRTAVRAAGAELVEPGSEVRPRGVPTTLEGGPEGVTTSTVP